MKDKIYRLFPNFLQELMISLFNYQAYKVRYGGKYKFYREKFKNNREISREELLKIQEDRFTYFLHFSRENTIFYNHYEEVSIGAISTLPILKKEDLRIKIKEFFTTDKKNGVVSKTGGTTGKSLEILFTQDNMQERFAMLDDFRSRIGYELGKKTAWFSGKALLTDRDVKRNRFWKNDYWHRVRYYSTFHIHNKYLKYYVEDLIKFKPEFFVGFPSSILEIAKFGIANNYDFPANTVKAIFPTAETITPEMREVIERFFKTKMYNQYASSEGAPFIFECSEGKLHLELQSGIFEVLSDDNQPLKSGKLVVTSFTTEGTPLIRYDIGDAITLEDSDKFCTCGNNNPLVKEILGRIDDYVYSPQNGKINLGNVSNTLKDTKGIKGFQVIQNKLDEIDIYVSVDNIEFNERIHETFKNNWLDRVGHEMKINFHFTDGFDVEKSGKFRMVKNNIKHLLE